MALLHEQIEGKYEILEKIREGGMGAIYKVRHRLLDEVRVVKVIRSHSAPGSGAGERFLREARAAIRLRHPNIAVLHDFAVDADGNAFIVMEFIDGWTLLEVLSGYGPPPLPLALEIARQALKALAYLHRQKIVHRDISPDNLMLTRDVDGLPLVKLIDLGIAKALEGGDGLTTTGSFLGKPRYAAPEQFGGTGLDVRSDLYSFGVVFYELLTGRCPISGQDPPSYMAGHLLRPPLDFALSDPDGSLPDDLREIVLQALAKKPEERLGSADELARAVQSVHARFPFSARDLDAMLGVLLPLAPIHEAFAPAAPGSTQDRLDWQFAMNETPPPESRTEATPSPGDADLQAMETRILRAALPPPPKPDRAAILMGPAEGEEELSLDATWATRPWRRPSGLPVTAPAAPPAPIMVELPPVRRRLLPLAAGLVLAAVALGSGIGWYLRQGEPAVTPPASGSPPLPAPPALPARAAAHAALPAAVLPAAPAAEKPAPTAPARSEATSSNGSSRGSRHEQSSRTVLPEEPAAPPDPMKRGDLIRAGPGVSEPVPLDLPHYAYPAAARGSGQKVSVRLALLVDEEGRVVEAIVRKGGPPGLGFGEAAVDAARRTRFQPATRDDIPGKMWTEMILDFAE